MNQFINQLKQFLKKAELVTHETDFREVNLGNVIDMKQDLSEVVYGRVDISSNLILRITLFFGLLDARVDELHSGLEGLSFREKCKSLPHSTDDEIILRETYRVLKILRNASVHSINSIREQNGLILCSYQNKKTHTVFELNITNYALELIQTMVLRLMEPTNTFYAFSMNRAYYDGIKAGISLIKDDLTPSSALMQVSNQERVNYPVRYIVKNVSVSCTNTTIEVKTPYNTPPQQYCDYVFKHNSKEYRVPEEVMLNNKIQLTDLSKWEA